MRKLSDFSQSVAGKHEAVAQMVIAKLRKRGAMAGFSSGKGMIASFPFVARAVSISHCCRFPFQLSLSIFHVVTDLVTTPHVSRFSEQERPLTS